jgi:hypothetical protein
VIETNKKQKNGVFKHHRFKYYDSLISLLKECISELYYSNEPAVTMDIMCNAITKQGSPCCNKGKYGSGCDFACGIHATKSVDRRTCEALTLHGKICSKYGTYSKHNTWYCGSHVNMVECCICMKMISTKTKTTTLCNHVFHTNCIKKWSKRNQTCPICRSSLTLINSSNIRLDFITYKLIVTQLLPRSFSHDGLERLCYFYNDNLEMCDIICTPPPIWNDSLKTVL